MSFSCCDVVSCFAEASKANLELVLASRFTESHEMLLDELNLIICVCKLLHTSRGSYGTHFSMVLASIKINDFQKQRFLETLVLRHTIGVIVNLDGEEDLQEARKLKIA